jgi:phage tail sheath protein FI
MATDFLHGVEVVTVDGGPRPIQTIRSAIIGLIGTAPEADVTKFPLNTPVLVTSRGGYAGIGATGTLAKALAGIYEQFSPFVVVIRVAEDVDANVTSANVIGGVDVVSGARTGVQAFRDSQVVTGVAPMILIAPGFTSVRPVGLASVVVTAPGTGYSAAPTVTITGGGNDAGKVLPTAEAVLGTGANAGKVTAINILTHGAKLTDTLVVAIAPAAGDNTGAGATATAHVDKYANPVASALESIADGLRAHCVVTATNTTDADALAYRQDFGSRRIFIVDPYAKVFDTTVADYVSEDAAARVAGLIARIDAEQGFWKSPSNEEIYGIGGLDRAIDYALGDPNTRANLLNENDVATIIRDDGWRLWGNRTASGDPMFAFLCVSRSADMIDLSIQRAHRWACDKGITRGYLDDVTSAVNGYLRYLTALGAILGGRCFVDPDLNPVNEIQAGHVTFSYEFTPTYPAERVTFRSSITSEFVSALFA